MKSKKAPELKNQFSSGSGTFPISQTVRLQFYQISAKEKL